MSRKQYTREFKIEAVQLSEESDQPIIDVPNDLGINPNTLYKRRKQLLEDGEEAFPGPGKMKASDEEVRRLWRELARTREERDVIIKPSPSSPGKANEVPFHPGACGPMPSQADV
jgi:transposase